MTEKIVLAVASSDMRCIITRLLHCQYGSACEIEDCIGMVQLTRSRKMVNNKDLYNSNNIVRCCSQLRLPLCTAFF